MTIQEGQLGQLRPANTTAASLYSPAASTTWVAKSLWICNTSGAPAKARVFHDENGSTYDETTALFWDITIEADETITVNDLMAGSDSSGNIGVRTDTANALTFTLYGAEITS
jgi:hypothetical protein